MMTTGVPGTLEVLTTEEPSYDELIELYEELQTGVSRSPDATVGQRALAQVLREFLDYLDFVEADLEKSIGVSRSSERKRLLAALEQPRGATPVERVHRFVRQWESLERYSREEVTAAFEA